jgi:hypothetical protein
MKMKQYFCKFTVAGLAAVCTAALLFSCNKTGSNGAAVYIYSTDTQTYAPYGESGDVFAEADTIDMASDHSVPFGEKGPDRSLGKAGTVSGGTLALAPLPKSVDTEKLFQVQRDKSLKMARVLLHTGGGFLKLRKQKNPGSAPATPEELLSIEEIEIVYSNEQGKYDSYQVEPGLNILAWNITGHSRRLSSLAEAYKEGFAYYLDAEFPIGDSFMGSPEDSYWHWDKYQ